jgi:glycosyltransferase involved in cell wall biosynthesis
MYQTTRLSVARTRKRFPFDVILAAWGYPDAEAALRLARQYGCPLVTNLLGSDMNDLANRPDIRDILASTVRASQAIIVMSEVMAKDVVGLGVPRSKVTVQHNGVDRERFGLRDKQELRARLGLPLQRPLVVFIGNLVPVKGPDVLVAAFAKLREDMSSDAMLVIVGDGGLRGSLEQSLERRGLLPHVRFTGRRPHSEMPDWISAADVLCLPSRTEGCPNVVLEALSSGRPVVATRVGAVPDLLTESTGRLVDVGDANGLAEALAATLSTKWEADLIRASIAHLTWGSVAKTYFQVLEGTLKPESAALPLLA